MSHGGGKRRGWSCIRLSRLHPVQWPLYLTAPASPGAFFCADAIQSHLISRTASQFDPLVQQYIKLDHDGDAKAKGFYNDHMNDPPASRMSDFNNMPIIQWPSVEAYDAFKEWPSWRLSSPWPWSP